MGKGMSQGQRAQYEQERAQKKYQEEQFKALQQEVEFMDLMWRRADLAIKIDSTDYETGMKILKDKEDARVKADRERMQKAMAEHEASKEPKKEEDGQNAE